MDSPEVPAALNREITGSMWIRTVIANYTPRDTVYDSVEKAFFNNVRLAADHISRGYCLEPIIIRIFRQRRFAHVAIRLVKEKKQEFALSGIDVDIRNVPRRILVSWRWWTSARRRERNRCALGIPERFGMDPKITDASDN